MRMREDSESVEEVETDSIETLRCTSDLAVRAVQSHDRAHTLRDKTARHVRHDDCCGYCERYCQDKITRVKRREIEAWRQDVGVTMEMTRAAHAHKTKKPKLTYLKYSNIGEPDTEPGFRRIKTPKDLLQPSVADRSGGKSKSWANQGRPHKTIDVADLSPVYQATDVSLNSSSMSEQEVSDERGLVPVKTPMSTTFSRDSLDDSLDDADSDIDKPELFLPSAQHSYRSCSNELLNVITIDDAIKKHREHLLRNKDIKTAKPTRQRKVAAIQAPPQLALEGISLTEKRTESPEQLSEASEFCLHPPSALSSRPTSKFSSTSLNESVDLGMRSSTRHSQYRGLRSSSDAGERISRRKSQQTSNFNVMLRAVDGVVTNHNVAPGEFLNNRQGKPPSKRFHKMNKNLRYLIHKEYLPDPKMAERLQYFEQQKGTDGHKGSPLGEPLWTSSAHPAAARARQRDHGAGEQQTEQPTGSSNGGGFLSMLTDYKDTSDSGEVE